MRNRNQKQENMLPVSTPETQGPLPKAPLKLDWPKFTSTPSDMNMGTLAFLPRLCLQSVPEAPPGPLQERRGSLPVSTCSKQGSLTPKKRLSLVGTGLLEAKETQPTRTRRQWELGSKDSSGHLSLVMNSAAEPPQAGRKEAHSSNSTALGTWPHFRAMSCC